MSLKTVDPIARVERWRREAMRHRAPLPEAAALATATSSGDPSVRYVILRDIDDRGFVFYTDARSRKGAELRTNGRAALAIYWNTTGKQIRIEGTVEEVESELPDTYWQGRSRGKRLAVIASTQSAPLARRSELLARFRRLRSRYRSKEVPRPPHWIGFRIVPRAIEFWIQHGDWLQQRELFTRHRGTWRRRLLQP